MTAARDGRVLLREDNDYGEIAFRSEMEAPEGIILLRMGESRTPERVERLLAVLQEVGQHVLGHFVVIDDFRVRVRPMSLRR